jgi:NADPH2:quinone reductase
MVHEELCRLFADGAIEPLVGQVLPLAEAPQAMAAIADRGTVGKVVLKP